MTLLEQMTTEANFNAAWNKVRTNLGAPGIDRISIDEFEKNLHDNLTLLRQMVQAGNYEPLPYKEFTQKKESGKDRILHIPTVRDRIVQQALLFVIQPIFEKIFLNCSYAYRPGKSAQKAIERVERNLQKGRKWIVIADIENFFDEIDRQLLLDTVAKTIHEKPVIKLIEKCINALEAPDGKGIAQGMVIAPILSNIYLHSMDDQMSRALWQYIRYSDNIILLDHNEEQVQQALERATTCIQDLKLKLNPEKTKICNLNQGFTFLGFQFDERGKRPAEPAIRRIEKRVGNVLQKASEYSQSQLKEKLESIIRGWVNYFKLHESDKRKLLMQIEENSIDQKESLPQRILLAALAYQLGDRSRAETILRTTPVIDSEDAEINYQWGILCDLLEMNNEALDSFLAAFRI
ncbi:MAG: group II intron reverse transcriptase/maturase, partial [bacterium]